MQVKRSCLLTGLPVSQPGIGKLSVAKRSKAAGEDEAETAKDRAKNAASAALARLSDGGKVRIKETVKFAGKTMEVERLLTAGMQSTEAYKKKLAAKALRAAKANSQPESSAAASTESAPQPAAAKQVAGLDAIVAAIGKPEKISTLTKSSLDWDQYKAQHKLEDELEQKNKAG